MLDTQPDSRSDRAGTPPPRGPKETAILHGEEEYFRAKLAGGRQVRVLFQGEPPTRAIIDKLIAHLELAKDQFQETDSQAK